MLTVKKSLAHRLSKQKSFPDADKKQIVEAEDRLFEITNFLDLTIELVEAQKIIIEQFQIKQREAETDKRHSRTRIADLPHGPEYYHQQQLDAIDELRAELSALILNRTITK